MKTIHPFVLVAALSAAGTAHAQGTLGELLDQGAQKLTPAQVANMVPVRIVRQAVDSDAIMTMHANGTVAGMVHNKQGHGSSEASGTWSVDQTGKRCVDVAMPAFNMTWKQCGYMFRLGEQLYGAPSDFDRAAPAVAYSGTAFVTQ